MPAYIDKDDTLELEGELVLDLSDVSEEPVQDGWHHVRIAKATVVRTGEEAKEPGLLMMRLQAPIEDEDDFNNGEYVFFNAMLEGKWRKMAAGFWAAIGIETKQSHTFHTVQDLIDAVVDKRLDVQTKVKDDGDYGLRAEVKAYRAQQLGGDLGLTVS